MADKDFKVKSGLDLGTPLPLTEGGTGQTSANNALNALLPVQTDNSNKFLQTDGTSASWVAAAVANNATFTGSSMVIPSGTNAERPASPVVGAIRLNTDQGTLEFWTGSAWGAIATFPQPPRNLVATDVGTSRAFNNGSMTVAFDAPIGNGGSTVTSYKITSNPGSFVQTVNVPSTSATFTGLSSNTNYTFTGTSINSIGEGGASSASSAVLSTTIPEVPTIGAATDQGSGRAFNNGSASIAFTPGGTGGKSNTYAVTSSPGSYTASGTSPITVNGLQSNTSYTFTVIATNANGSSAASSATSSITATTVPQAPTIGTPTANGLNGQISVPFTAGATGGSAITGYTVTSSPGGFTGTGSSSPIVITGLTNGTSYTFTVTATNANGTSTSSNASSSAAPFQGATVSGGALTTDATYNYRTFTANGTLGISGGSINYDVLLLAGGGGGGYGYGGGGGAGGLVYSSQSLSPGSYSISIGGGGTGANTLSNSTTWNGTNSSMTGITTAIGGGGGGSNSENFFQSKGADGGSGGGRNGNYAGSGSGSGTSGQGFAGGDRNGASSGGAGGGGASAVGGNAGQASPPYGGAGGAGSTIFGTAYAGGGGGSGQVSGPAGGTGGGGAGGITNSPYTVPVSGTTNRGGGGGGGGLTSGGASANGASGGSGICVVRYLKSQTI